MLPPSTYVRIVGAALRGRPCDEFRAGAATEGRAYNDALAIVTTKTFFAPAAVSASAHDETVAPVVNTSSTRSMFSFAINLGRRTSNAPATVSRRPFASNPARYLSDAE